MSTSLRAILCCVRYYKDYLTYTFMDTLDKSGESEIVIKVRHDPNKGCIISGDPDPTIPDLSEFHEGHVIITIEKENGPEGNT